MQANNKTFVVTGGGSGMGREIVLLLLAKGARVAAIDLNADTLAETQSLAALNAARLSVHVMNITDKASVEALPQRVIDIHGQVDGLINNAGIIQPFVRVKDLGESDIERVMQVNFFATVHLTRAFLPYLLQRPEAHIVNISSMGGFLPVPGQTIYGASKAAVKLFTEGLYAELMTTPVKVTIVFPGAIATNITANSGVSIPANVAQSEQKFKALPADKAAAIIIDAMETNRYRVCVGSDARMMDWLYRLAPKFAARFIAKQMAALLG